MAIVETKIVIRPNTGIAFFNQTSNLAITQMKNSLVPIGPFTTISDTDTYYKHTNTSGSYIVERNYSSDLLTQTTDVTFDSLATWSLVDTAISIALDAEYFAYAEANGLTHPTSGQYGVTGISSSFTCTTTYTYSSNILDTYTLFDSFIDVIESSDKLTSFTNTGTQLIAVHTYTNAADFNENHWRDGTFVTSLHSGGVTRTIAYAMI